MGDGNDHGCTLQEGPTGRTSENVHGGFATYTHCKHSGSPWYVVYGFSKKGMSGFRVVPTGTIHSSRSRVSKVLGSRTTGRRDGRR